jgi:tRNA-splicing ligase RtcB
MKQVITTERLPIKLWLDDMEDGAMAQARNLANLPFAYKWVAIMPDSHQGYGMPIGGVLALDRVIIPNAVGVDIGCGMVAVKTTLTEISEDELKATMGLIRETIPTGFKHQQEEQYWEGFDRAPDIPIIQQELKSARKQLGTLGGGNHFIEIQEDEGGYIWLMIHSGSRNFGLKTAGEYHKKAKQLCERWVADIPHPDLSFLPMEDRIAKEYYEAMNFALDFAEANRALMMDRAILALLDVMVGMTSDDFEEVANIHHNYAAWENHYGKNVLVHRKGATKATEKTIGIIPGSMGTSSYIVRGRGNPESFESCSHGAGRRMGRKQAKRTLDLAEEQAKMEGILGKPRSEKELDEAPGAYKNIDVVMANQEDLVDIVYKLRPLASIKG